MTRHFFLITVLSCFICVKMCYSLDYRAITPYNSILWRSSENKGLERYNKDYVCLPMKARFLHNIYLGLSLGLANAINDY